jgi:NSS family neurotransmitter:Na+ symporter
MSHNAPDESTHRGQWTSRHGFVLAAAGSAIGLGNLWKFPYIAWSNHGGGFVFVYLIAILSVGLPIMMAEILVGRRTQKSCVGALRETLGSAWTGVGILGVVTGTIILSYYTVIAGWSLRYVVTCIRWSWRGFVAEDSSAAAFSTFSADGPLQVLLAISFMAATMGVVYRGIGGGIEAVARRLMPALFVILFILLIGALRMEGAVEALNFLLIPDFSQFQARGALEALGHAFFTLSLGMGAMITYGSYLKRNESIVRAATTVVILDTLIAVVTAFIMFAVIFSVPGLREKIGSSTVGMLFITLPNLFYTAVPLGQVLAPLFYLLVAFAALTSTISLFEVAVSYVIDQHGLLRRKAVLVCGLPVVLCSILCGLSFGGWKALSSFSLVYTGTDHAKFGLFEHLDYLAANWLLPIGGFLITLGVGWVMTRKRTETELVDENTPAWFHYGIWRFSIRYLAPVAVAVILAAVIFGKDFS